MMMKSNVLIDEILNGIYDSKFQEIYKDPNVIEYQKKRYANAVANFEREFGVSQVEVFSAPGRSEICGNHTDHQRGRVLAASINKDAIAIVKKTDECKVKVISEGFPMISVDITNLDFVYEEKETTSALIKGVLRGIVDRGYKVGGFDAYITSDVLIGAGLSSSAAFETLIGTIESGLYNDFSIDSVEIAKIGKFAENEFFGKPCGLMDQMACSVGELIYIDFEDTDSPKIKSITLDLDKYEYSLCITDTKGSHADLTPDYAAIPKEMCDVAKLLGKEVLREATVEELHEKANEIREEISGRAFIRAIHFVNENDRVVKAVKSIEEDRFNDFLKIIDESGDSSFKYLQNIYSTSDVYCQNISVALAISEQCLGGDGVCRIHGGGFAGTIQAFVKNKKVNEYKETMEKLFGEHSCQVLKIRKYGGIKVV